MLDRSMRYVAEEILEKTDTLSNEQLRVKLPEILKEYSEQEVRLILAEILCDEFYLLEHMDYIHTILVTYRDIVLNQTVR